jgi:hypothetical protein
MATSQPLSDIIHRRMVVCFTETTAHVMMVVLILSAVTASGRAESSLSGILRSVSTRHRVASFRSKYHKPATSSISMSGKQPGSSSATMNELNEVLRDESLAALETTSNDVSASILNDVQFISGRYRDQSLG